MSVVRELGQAADGRMSRRSFGTKAIATGLLAAAGSTLAGKALLAQSSLDLDILNFALNLEYLEAEFYTVAATGQRLQDVGIGVTGTGTAGPTTGGARVTLSKRTATVASHIAADEQAHVVFLRNALGSAAVAKPAINLDALGLGFANENEFLTLARAFEDLGVSAYGGAAASIGSRQILTAAAQIALTEAQHAGVLRLLVSDAAISVPQVDNMDVPPLMSPNGRLFQVDNWGLSTIRTPSQVLAVGGAFFPGGVNGAINS
ncbi:MAG: ferritin-like domain-containing protein [Vicinamibacterales bacterium]